MGFGKIDPKYEVIEISGSYSVFGTEQTTGETFSLYKIPDKNLAFRLAHILNEGRVSVHHADDVIRDSLFELLLR